MIVVPRGLRGVFKLVAIDLKGERVEANLTIIDRYVAFAHHYNLIRDDQETELVEMLINGAKFAAAIDELRR